jgi:hypothetical protein
MTSKIQGKFSIQENNAGEIGYEKMGGCWIVLLAVALSLSECSSKQ